MMSSLYVGASGMRGLSKGMQVISNNLANQNTVAFKQSMMLYQNLMSSTVMTNSNFNTNISQKGLGVAILESRTSYFDQGAFELSNTVTDLGISGIGYFGVEKNGATHYTRAGNFRFDKEGNLLDPSGYNLLGKAIVDGKLSGSTVPIKLDIASGGGLAVHPAKSSSNINFTANLGSTEDLSNDPNNPFFALAANWDGTATTALGSGQYSHEMSLNMYDADGNAYPVTVYYDFASMQNGKKVYEFVVATDPAADGSARAGTKSAGLLMSGTLSFNSSGDITGITAFTPSGTNPADLSSWNLANLKDGLPVLDVSFTGQAAQQVTLDLGLKLNNGWGAISSANDALNNPDVFYDPNNAQITRTNYTSTAYGGSSISRQLVQDGYPAGNINNLSFDEDGIVRASYSNGQSEDLYQVMLYRFTSEDGLYHAGKNHFLATAESGSAEEGLPTSENYGGIVSYGLETSNVDLATEFTQMIITQRGFQMNSKVVTTSDQMLQKALEIKR